MRHQNKGFKLGRTQAHRKATLSALANALIKHKRIKTTLTKARALRMYVEPIINRAKTDSSHSRRQVFRYLQDKHAVKELFGDIAEQIGDRPGGYTRIVKLGQRAGDSAPVAIIELVDYNDEKPEGSDKGSGRRRTRRGGSRRRSGKKTGAAAAAATAETAVEEATDAGEEVLESVEEVAEEVMESVEEVAEEVVDSAEEAVEEATESVEEVAEEVVDSAEEATEAVAEAAEEAAEAVSEDAPEEAADDAGEEATDDEEKKS